MKSFKYMPLWLDYIVSWTIVLAMIAAGVLLLSSHLPAFAESWSDAARTNNERTTDHFTRTDEYVGRSTSRGGCND